MKLASAIGLAALVAGGAARADNARADEQFRLGKKLLAQKHYADACAAFEESNRIDPGIGAELNVGHCYEEWGKFATAYRAYETAAQMAKSQHDNRLPKIKERMDALDPQVPRLTIDVPHGVDTTGLKVSIDGQAFALAELGKEQRLDPGPHKIDYSVGDERRNKLIPLERGGASDITLDVPSATVSHDDTPVKAHGKKKRDKDASSEDDTDARPRHVLVAPGHTRRVEGAVAMSVGGAAMLAAGVITLSARGKYKDALDKDCGGSTSGCDPAGLTATHDALHEANIATIVTGVGAAVLITGVVLYVTAPKGRAREEREDAMLVPTVTPDGAGLAVVGRF